MYNERKKYSEKTILWIYLFDDESKTVCIMDIKYIHIYIIYINKYLI